MLDIFDFESRRAIKNAEELNPYTDDFFNDLLKTLEQRVDKKRYIHTLGVIEMAEILSDVYGVDKQKARLAAVLHDWDKGYADEEMRERIYSVGADSLVDKEVIEKMPKILHGTTAAFALGIQYPNIPSDVLKAVINHTTGDIDMSDLDKVIYIADAIDPSRNYPGYDSIVNMVGKISLDDLFTKTFCMATIAVLEKGKPLHPRTVVVWNHTIEEYNKRHNIIL